MMSKEMTEEKFHVTQQSNSNSLMPEDGRHSQDTQKKINC